MNPLDVLKPLALPNRASVGLLFVRLVAGLAFMFHGWGKIQNPLEWMNTPEAPSPVPGILQALAAISEFVGGAAWILGLLTPLFSLGLACTMAVAVYVHASVMGHPFVAGPTGGGSYEPAAGYLTVAILLLLAGPGAYSVDHCLFRDKAGSPPPI